MLQLACGFFSTVAAAVSELIYIHGQSVCVGKCDTPVPALLGVMHSRNVLREPPGSLVGEVSKVHT